MCYKFATSLLRGAPKGLGRQLAQLVEEVVFIVPQSILQLQETEICISSKSLRGCSPLCPRLRTVDIREAAKFNFRRGGETICIFSITKIP